MDRPSHQVFHRYNEVSREYLFTATQLLVHLRVLHPNYLQLAVFEVEHDVTLAEVIVNFSHELADLRIFLPLSDLGHVRDVDQFLCLTLNVELNADAPLEDLV